MKTFPIALHFCQSRIKFLTNSKLTLKNLPKWGNFAESGRAGLSGLSGHMRCICAALMHSGQVLACHEVANLVSD